MGRFAHMAETHWRRYLPQAYAALDDPTKFFAELEDDAQQQVEDLAEGLRGAEPDGESFADRMSRYMRARQTAEEIVISEVVLAPLPEDPDA